MELIDFFRQVQQDVRVGLSERATDTESYTYPETMFAEVVMEHMAEIGMTEENKEVCHFERVVKNARLRLSGYALSDDSEQMDLFVSLYEDVDEIISIPDSETKKAAEQCLRFLTQAVQGNLARQIDESDEAYPFVMTLMECYPNLEQIRVYVLTNKKAKTRQFKSREVGGKTIKLEVMDIERLYRHWSEGKPRDELIINFEDISGSPLPCVYIPGETTEYDYILTAIPGEALRFIYDKFGPRLLEANVRSYLSMTGKVNKGIRDTLKTNPEHFMAYNNGVVLVADEKIMRQTTDGGAGLSGLKGLQIVNGGQTTASLYFTKKKNPETDLSRVRVPAKIIVLNGSVSEEQEEELISRISQYSNSQNAVKTSDFSANKPYHVELERLSISTYCPDGVGRWFYERAAGSYNVMLSRQGTTPAKLKQLKSDIPPARKITKTDLAKYLNIWDQKPEIASLGGQKNFIRFMEDLSKSGDIMPDIVEYKRIIAKIIIYKKSYAIVRPLFEAYRVNIATYLVALLANRVGERFNLERVWEHQDISRELQQLLYTWAHEVNDVLRKSAGDRMVSEWAKKPECWKTVRDASYSNVPEKLPEIMN